VGRWTGSAHSQTLHGRQQPSPDDPAPLISNTLQRRGGSPLFPNRLGVYSLGTAHHLTITRSTHTRQSPGRTTRLHEPPSHRVPVPIAILLASEGTERKDAREMEAKRVVLSFGEGACSGRCAGGRGGPTIYRVYGRTTPPQPTLLNGDEKLLKRGPVVVEQRSVLRPAYTVEAGKRVVRMHRAHHEPVCVCGGGGGGGFVPYLESQFMRHPDYSKLFFAYQLRQNGGTLVTSRAGTFEQQRSVPCTLHLV
jgi:hypothetical protein